jgi:hypothetical protein
MNDGDRIVTLRASSSSFVRVTLAAGLLLVASACGVHGLSFVQDKRVDVVRPHDRSKVRLPLTVGWTVKDFSVGPGAGSFGVFVDRSPQPSGRTLTWLFRGDRGCTGSGAAACATPDFLAQRNVYRTTDTNFTVDQVTRLTGSQAGRPLHEVTIVLLDAAGKRVGEGAWSVQFEVKGEG